MGLLIGLILIGLIAKWKSVRIQLVLIAVGIGNLGARESLEGLRFDLDIGLN